MTERVRLEIEGMSCGHCVAAVRRALEGVPGAEIEEVQIGSATVRIDPARVSSDSLVDAVSDEGYAAQAVPA